MLQQYEDFVTGHEESGTALAVAVSSRFLMETSLRFQSSVFGNNLGP